ncbi:MAG: tetratricopeptide repeat protein [Pirellulaceae bacterium]|jgi:lysophospholipase L1-like esterase|nr:tetratricopeptide repeat protein [Pirellulaceae bacterium]
MPLPKPANLLPPKKLWLLRLATVLLALSPFLALEGVLRLLPWPRFPPAADPFVDLHNLRPLFQLDTDSGRMAISPERFNLFRPATFALHKPADTFRVFALGGSTTQGEPYSTETAFPQWLQLDLQAAVPDRQVEVINCGGLSYASYRVLAILREVLRYDPDLIIVYSGHNEYLERRTYAPYHSSSLFNRSLSWLAGLRTVQLARNLAGQSAQRPDPQEPSGSQAAILQAEVDALLDYEGGLAEYERGALWMKPIAEHFRWNLQQMCTECQQVDVPLILARPVSNLLDCPPFKFESDPLLSPDTRHQFDQHWQAAREALEAPDLTDELVPESREPSQSASREQAMDELHRALAIDPQHAGALYLLGQLQWASGDYPAARETLSLARDFDVCPLRATSELAVTVTQVAQQNHVPLLDAEQLFSQRSPHELVGSQWLVDHVHPKLEGHQLLGYELARLCFELELLPPPPDDWDSRRQALIAEHLSTLNEAYFHRGQQRLAGLRLWTQGRAKKIRSQPSRSSDPPQS